MASARRVSGCRDADVPFSVRRLWDSSVATDRRPLENHVMAYLTRAEAIRAAQADLGYLRLAESELRKSAKAPRSARFDVFPSHSSEDAQVIAGVQALLEADGLSVYVDWLEDPQLDRSRVTPATAELLRSGWTIAATSLTPAQSLRRAPSGCLGSWATLTAIARTGWPSCRLLARAETASSVWSTSACTRSSNGSIFSQLGRRFGRRTGETSGDVLKSLARS